MLRSVKKSVLSILALCLLATSCDKEDSTPIFTSIVVTEAVSDIAENAAVANGEVIDDGNTTVTERGFCWSVNSEVSIADNKISVGKGKGKFNTTLSGLNDFTTYYVKAYAVNSEGISYGSTVSFKTKQKIVDITCESTITDADGNVYKVVKIGSQCWMESNLNTSKYNNGTLIAQPATDAEWNESKNGSWCFYKNAADSSIGKLYNWYAASATNICPNGYRVPTERDMDRFLDFLGIEHAFSVKSVTGWPEGKNGNNATGFNFFPAGSRFASAGFVNRGRAAFLWTADTYDELNAKIYALGDVMSAFTPSNQKKNTGACIRCMKN